MKLKDVAARGNIDVYALEDWLRKTGKFSQWVKEGFMGMSISDSADVNAIINEYHSSEQKRKEEENEAKAQAEEEERKKQKALASMLISSGFSFEGYRIVKYSGYISGDDVTQIEKEKSFWTGMSKTDVGNALTESLVRIRRKAIAELKEAAYDLGCNAVIGVDFDYITLDPQVHNGQFTQDLPYVFCVTANGNAVVIEKEEK